MKKSSLGKGIYRTRSTRFSFLKVRYGIFYWLNDLEKEE